MNEFSGIAVILTFFIVRFVLPVGVVMGTGYLANHLLDRSERKHSEAPQVKPAA